MSNTTSAASTGLGSAGASACDAIGPGIFGPGFRGHLDWETDPEWEPSCWKDVAAVGHVDKSVWPLHIYYPRAPLTPSATPAPSVDTSSCEGVGDGDKLFECWICQKTYKRKNDARIHVGEVHLQLFRFFCPICPHKTSRGWSYDRHLRNVHKVRDREEAEREKDTLKARLAIKKGRRRSESS